MKKQNETVDLVVKAEKYYLEETNYQSRVVTLKQSQISQYMDKLLEEYRVKGWKIVECNRQVTTLLSKCNRHIIKLTTNHENYN
jgi:hypothetical protein